MRVVFLCSLLLLSSSIPTSRKKLSTQAGAGSGGSKGESGRQERENLAAAMIRRDCAAKLAAK